MSYIKPSHHVITSHSLAGFAATWQIDVLLVGIWPDGANRPILSFKTTYRHGENTEGPKLQDYICDVPGDASVSVSIDPSIRSWCRWSNRVLGITAKAYYNELHSIEHENGKIKFSVKRSANPLRHRLYFNLQILFGITVGGLEIWKDWSYDPDVINPRPDRLFDYIELSENVISEFGLDEGKLYVAPSEEGSDPEPLILVS